MLAKTKNDHNNIQTIFFMNFLPKKHGVPSQNFVKKGYEITRFDGTGQICLIHSLSLSHMMKRNPTCYWTSKKTFCPNNSQRKLIKGRRSAAIVFHVDLAENQDHDVQKFEAEGGDDVMLDEALLHPTSDHGVT
jgi:hypothetical protein